MLRKVLFLLTLLWLLGKPVHAQGVVRIPGVSGLPGTVTVTASDAYIQATSGTITGSGGWEVQDGACGASLSSTSCSLDIFPTTAGSIMRFGITTGNNLTVLTAFSCVTSKPCLSSSGDKVDTFSTCTGCHIFNSGNDNEDALFVIGGAGGAAVVTINDSGASTGFLFTEFKEYAPPNCNGAPCAMVLDNGGNGSTADGSTSGCSPCTGPSFTVTGEDLIIEQIDSGSVINSTSAGYVWDFIGDPAALDTTSGSAVTFATSNYFTLTANAFKTVIAYTPPSSPFSLLNVGAPSNFNTLGLSCTPTCPAITLPQTLGVGNLLFIHSQVVPGATQATLASVTDNGTGGSANSYTIPSAANTCKNTSGTVDLSCGWTVATRTSTTTFTPVMSTTTTAYFTYYETSASSGTIGLADQNSSNSSVAGSTVTAPNLSPSGGSGVYVCFAELGWASSSQVEYVAYGYPGAQGSNFFGGFAADDAQGVSMLLLNARNGNGPKVRLNASTASQEGSNVCFHN